MEQLINFAQENVLTKSNVVTLAKKHKITCKFNFNPANGELRYLHLKNNHCVVLLRYDESLILATTLVHGTSASKPDADAILYPYHIGTRITLYHYDGDWKIMTNNAYIANEMSWLSAKTYGAIVKTLILDPHGDTLDKKYSYSFVIVSRDLNIFVDEEKAILIDVRRGVEHVSNVLASHPLHDQPIITGSECKFGYVHRTPHEMIAYPSNISKIITSVLNHESLLKLTSPSDQDLGTYREKYLIVSIVFDLSSTALEILTSLTTRHNDFIAAINAKVYELKICINKTTYNMLLSYKTSTEPFYRYIVHFMDSHKRSISSLLSSPDGEKVVEDLIKDTDPTNLRLVLSTLTA